MRVVVVTPPAPATLIADARAQLGFDTFGAFEGPVFDDARIEGLIASAMGEIDGPDGWLGRAVGIQTLEARFEAFDAVGLIRLPYPPHIKVVSVKYVDAGGVEQTVAPSSYELAGETVQPAPGSRWPAARVAAETVRVRYQAGYVADPGASPLVPAIPAPIKQAILLLVEAEYDGDQSGELKARADKMLSRFRRWC